jgi:hypothetical protein
VDQVTWIVAELPLVTVVGLTELTVTGVDPAEFVKIGVPDVLSDLNVMESTVEAQTRRGLHATRVPAAPVQLFKTSAAQPAFDPAVPP